jgi:hypothetical protein
MKYLGKDATPFTSQAEVTLWMRDPRYSGKPGEQDPVFQQHVVAKLALTDDSAVPVPQNGTLEAAMSTPSPQFQDINGDLSKLTDRYHDFTEARKDQASELYRESAYERERVAQKIGRSVPDEAVHSHKSVASYQVPVEGEAGQQ